jgi:hypothetical protein
MKGLYPLIILLLTAPVLALPLKSNAQDITLEEAMKIAKEARKQALPKNADPDGNIISMSSDMINGQKVWKFIFKLPDINKCVAITAMEGKKICPPLPGEKGVSYIEIDGKTGRILRNDSNF